MSGFKDVDSWRKFHLSIAEFIDAWRLIPRATVALFGYGAYHVVKWYMGLAPHLIEGCIEAGGTVEQCIAQAPTSQHTALVSALFALAGVVFAFYTNNSRKWNGFSPWNKNPNDDNTRDVQQLNENKKDCNCQK